MNKAIISILFLPVFAGPCLSAETIDLDGIYDLVKTKHPIFKKERLVGDGGDRWVGELPEGGPQES